MSRPFESPLPEPLAYFLTWPTYGTWLPGDERGWVKRHHGMQPPDVELERASATRMTEPACCFNLAQRQLVESTISAHCRRRGWQLFAVNCRSNHVHVVVQAPDHPDIVRDQLKSWTTRALKTHQSEHTGGTHSFKQRTKWWAERGSKRYINNEAGLEAAIRYVQDVQDGPRD